jgi:hypothetical protein
MLDSYINEGIKVLLRESFLACFMGVGRRTGGRLFKP